MQAHHVQKVLSALLYLAIGAIILGMLFDFQHYAIDKYFFTAGWAGILIIYPTKVLLRPGKNFGTYNSIVMAITLAGSALLYIYEMPLYQYGFRLFFILLAIWLPYTIYQTFKHYRSQGYKAVTFILSLVAIATTLYGIFAKFNHLPYGEYAIIGGLILLGIWFIQMLILEKQS